MLAQRRVTSAASWQPGGDTLSHSDTFHFSGARHKSRNKMKIVSANQQCPDSCANLFWFWDGTDHCQLVAGQSTRRPHTAEIFSLSANKGNHLESHLRRGSQRQNESQESRLHGRGGSWAPKLTECPSWEQLLWLGPWGQISGICRLPSGQVVLHFKQTTGYYSSLCVDGIKGSNGQYVFKGVGLHFMADKSKTLKFGNAKLL